MVTKARIFYLPFYSYRWINSINAQKALYDDNNYLSPTDPIFSSPIYINTTSGYVSNNTVKDRIDIYHRLFNLSCEYYDYENTGFKKDGVAYKNFTSKNYIHFQHHNI